MRAYGCQAKITHGGDAVLKVSCAMLQQHPKIIKIICLTGRVMIARTLTYIMLKWVASYLLRS